MDGDGGSLPQEQMETDTAVSDGYGDLNGILRGADMSSKTKVSRLLRLPPELRVTIYEHCLIQPRDIMVTPQLEEPPFLSACHVIRAEALQIWYKQNRFVVRVQDCDAKLLRAFTRRHLAVRGFARRGIVAGKKYESIANLAIAIRGHNWANLRQWARWVVNKEVYAVTAVTWHEDPESTDAVICGVMDVALNAKDWSSCEVMLQRLYRMLCVLDAKWANGR